MREQNVLFEGGDELKELRGLHVYLKFFRNYTKKTIQKALELLL
jgi:hypothetical protein